MLLGLLLHSLAQRCGLLLVLDSGSLGLLGLLLGFIPSSAELLGALVRFSSKFFELICMPRLSLLRFFLHPMQLSFVILAGLLGSLERLGELRVAGLRFGAGLAEALGLLLEGLCCEVPGLLELLPQPLGFFLRLTLCLLEK